MKDRAAGLTALFTLSVPVLLAVGGAALVSGALYGLVVGGRLFNWVEAAIGSVIGGISAGVGGWLPGSGSQPPTSRRVGRRAWSATWSTPRSAPSAARWAPLPWVASPPVCSWV
ncbi:hypothetical protein [Symbiobacterium thermophilum]|uniref:hypothetical protein n=1 Tax=Symbiobacterium thermophilum TaxID=2734 RepID=UPI0035C6D8DC